MTGIPPAPAVPYGALPDHVANLHLPAGTGPFPVVVLVHGGFWRARYGRELEHAVARDPALQLAAVALSPEAAVDEHGDVGRLAVQLADLGRMVPVPHEPIRPRQAAML